MKHHGALPLIFLAFFVSAGVSRAQQAQTLTARIDSLATALQAELPVVGAAVGVIENDEITSMRGLGFADRQAKVPISPETLFNVGSISKLVTAWGIMSLVYDGRLSLDEPVSSYLTSWTIPPSRFDPSGVTARRLMSHTAGLSVSSYGGFAEGSELPDIVASLRGATNGSGAVELIFEPGTAVRYSGGGYTVLQLLVEDVSGESFAEYMETALLHPLGMFSTTFRQFPDSSLAARIAVPHVDDNDRPAVRQLFTASAAAGLYTTLADMMILARAELRLRPNGNKLEESLLPAEFVDAMHTPVPPSQSWGMGHQVRRLGEHVVVGHVGSNQGWLANFQVNLTAESAIIVLTNSSAGFTYHNALVCEWLFVTTDIQSWEFCQTLPRSRLFDLREEIRAWGEQDPTEAERARAFIETINAARSHLEKGDISATIASVRVVAATAPTSNWRQRAAAIADHLDQMARR